MFNFFTRKMKTSGPKQKSAQSENFSVELMDNVKENLENIKRLLDNPNDLVTREITLGLTGHKCGIVCIDGLVNKDIINRDILKNIQFEMTDANKTVPDSGDEIVSLLEHEILSVHEINRATTLDDVMLSVLSGDVALFTDGSKQVLVIDTRGGASRGIQEPETEALVRGPREGFNENIRDGTTLIRRRLHDPNLRFVSYRIGRRARKDVIVSYIDGIAQDALVNEVKRRIQSMDIDDAEGSGFIEQWISDSFLTPFPMIQSTERPDRVSGALLQGKIAILVDGTPFALILPITIGSFVQSPEDYYTHWLVSTLIRMLRMMAAFMATFLPALYIALVEFHQGMIPSKLAFSIAGTREGVPFPAVVEAIMMEITLELLREAGIRLPKPIGQTIGIVGGLVIGEAAVAAGIVSPIMVIVVAITAISSFALPAYSFAITLRILRFCIMLAASIFGLYGIVLAYIMINIHLVNLKSFGIPYSTPYSPTFLSDWKDIILRAPVTMMTKRPQMMQTEDKDKMNK